jgi:hypothetical protein
VLDHFDSTGIIQPEFEDLVYDALGKAGIEDRSARRKLAQDARLGVMRLTAEYGWALLHDFSRILSDANFGPASKDKLERIIRDIDKIAEMPGARVPESTFGSVRSVGEAADWIHNLGLKVLVPHKHPDEKLADAVQSYLREQAVTPKMARDLLRYANRATLEGRSALVRRAIRDFLPGKVERPKRSDQD